METEAAASQKLDSALTKRELFAAMAMQGMASRDVYTDMTVARMSVELADALLKELAK